MRRRSDTAIVNLNRNFKMRWLTSSFSIRSLKTKKKQHQLTLNLHNSIHPSIFSHLLSTSTTGAKSGYSKFHDVNRYFENIRFHKHKIFRGLSPDLINLNMLMKSYSIIGCTGYGLGVLGLILKWGFTPKLICISSLLNTLCKQLRINDACL